jgi:hypothetical protein
MVRPESDSPTLNCLFLNNSKKCLGRRDYLEIERLGTGPLIDDASDDDWSAGDHILGYEFIDSDRTVVDALDGVMALPLEPVEHISVGISLCSPILGRVVWLSDNTTAMSLFGTLDCFFGFCAHYSVD